MSEKTLDVRLRHAVKTEAEWISTDPVLLKGELAFSSDKKLFKQGDGVSKWSALSYNFSENLYGLTATIKELNYISGVKSKIQEQLDDKVPSARTINGKSLSSNISLTAKDVSADSKGTASTVVSEHNISNTAHDDIRKSISTLQNFVNNSATSADLSVHISDKVQHITTEERLNWNSAKSHADSIHARADATKTSKSQINGNILINGTEVNVYTHPSGTNPHNTTQADVGLGNVDNTSDINKPVSEAQRSAIDKALSDAKKHTNTEIASLINGAPETLDTLKEIADIIEINSDIMDTLNAAIGGKQDKITGAASTVTKDNLTANRTLVSDGNGKIAASAITTTKLGYLSDVTSNIQAQLNNKASSTHNHDTKYVNVSGDTMTGNLKFGKNNTIIQNQGDTPNYTEIIKWLKGGTSRATYDPQIGQFNNGGGDSSGSITILPYPTETVPWSGNVGLFIAKGYVNIDGVRMLTANNYTNYAPSKTGTGASGTWGISITGNAGTATALTTSAGSAGQPIYFSGGKPVACSYELHANVNAYSGSLASNGWKTLGGRTNDNSINIAYNNNAAVWNSGNYSSSLVFGGQDTKGLIDCSYNNPTVTFGGGSIGNSTDDAPKWYMKLVGANGATYILPSSDSTLVSTTGNVRTTGDGSMTLYAENSNELNFGGSSGGSEILIGYRAADNRPVPTKFIFGYTGTATLKAAYFEGTASNANQLSGYSVSATTTANTIALRTSAGYINATYFNQSSAAETPNTNSYIMYANSDGYLRKSSLANIKSVLGLGSAAYTNSSAYAPANHSHNYLPISGGTVNGDLTVNGQQYSINPGFYVSGFVSTGAWYRVFSSKNEDNAGGKNNILLTIGRSYNSPQNENYMFSISVGYNGQISITQLSGVTGGHLIRKIRVAYKNVSTYYIDFYSTSGSTYSNTYYVYGIGSGIFQAPTLVSSLDSDYIAYEFETDSGCKSNYGFIGSLNGNSSTATVAAKLGRSGNSSVPMTFNWSGQSGQPVWLWGGNDGSNMYVYNPSNFNVDSAKRLAGFTVSSYSGWGIQTGSVVGSYWETTSGGGIGFRNNCPTSAQVSMVIDGYIYQNEGRYMCLDTANYSSYALPLTGGTLTGNVSFRTTNYTSNPIQIFDENTTYGHTIKIGAGGTTIVGAGESADAFYGTLTDRPENLYLTADNNIYFYARCDTISNRVGMIYNTSGFLYPETNNSGSIGTSSYKWNKVYATNFYGAINGVTLEWYGSIDYSNTNWIAAWNSDGTKIKALSKSNFAKANHEHDYIKVNSTFDPNNAVIDALKLKIYDSYNVANTPTTYGNVLEINGIANHWKPQLWFDAGTTGNIRFRNRNYNNASFGSWRVLAFTDSNITGNAASATNADKLDGYHGSSSQTANTYVLRNSNGYIYTNYIHSNTSNSENPSISQVIVTNGSDGFYRKASLEHLKSTVKNKLFTSASDWIRSSELTKTITVTGDQNTFYPVVITLSSDKEIPMFVSVWKNLGSLTPSGLSGNHSNGTSSMWLQYEARNGGWDGNGGYLKTLYYYMEYASLCSHVSLLHSGVGHLCLWLRGGTCSYNISCTNSFSATVYYSSTNLGSSSYPVNVAPRSDIGNQGKYSTTHIAYGSLEGTASFATQLTTSAGSSTQPVYFSNGKPVACTYTLGKSVPNNAVFTDTNTHWTTRIYAGTSGTVSNTAVKNPYVKVTDDNTYRNQIRLVGDGATTVTSDSSGNITIFSTDTTYNTTSSITSGSSALITSGAVYTGLAGKANSSHTQSASTITAGTFTATGIVAATGTDYTTNRIRNIVFTTSDPGANVSTNYANGSLICVYE